PRPRSCGTGGRAAGRSTRGGGARRGGAAPARSSPRGGSSPPSPRANGRGSGGARRSARSRFSPRPTRRRPPLLRRPRGAGGCAGWGGERRADWWAIVERDQRGRGLSRVAAAHRDPARAGEVRRWLDQPAIDLYSGSVLGTAFLERRTVRLIDPTPVQVAGRYANLAGYPALLAVLGHHPVVAVPLVAAGRKVGAMVFLRRPDRPPFDDDEVALAVELAARAAVALAHARRYEQEHGTAAFL